MASAGHKRQRGPCAGALRALGAMGPAAASAGGRVARPVKGDGARRARGTGAMRGAGRGERPVALQRALRGAARAPACGEGRLQGGAEQRVREGGCAGQLPGGRAAVRWGEWVGQRRCERAGGRTQWATITASAAGDGGASELPLTTGRAGGVLGPAAALRRATAGAARPRWSPPPCAAHAPPAPLKLPPPATAPQGLLALLLGLYSSGAAPPPPAASSRVSSWWSGRARVCCALCAVVTGTGMPPPAPSPQVLLALLLALLLLATLSRASRPPVAVAHAAVPDAPAASRRCLASRCRRLRCASSNSHAWSRSMVRTPGHTRCAGARERIDGSCRWILGRLRVSQSPEVASKVYDVIEPWRAGAGMWMRMRRRKLCAPRRASGACGSRAPRGHPCRAAAHPAAACHAESPPTP